MSLDQRLQSPLDPSARALGDDLRDPRLLAACDEGRFGVRNAAFPVVVAWFNTPRGQFYFRLDCSGYPGMPPMGCLWDVDTALPLATDLWPVGGRADGVFRKDWSPSNGNAPYLACDRVALRTHPDWSTQLGNRAWSASKRIFDYLEQVADVFASIPIPQRASS